MMARECETLSNNQECSLSQCLGPTIIIHSAILALRTILTSKDGENYLCSVYIYKWDAILLFPRWMEEYWSKCARKEAW